MVPPPPISTLFPYTTLFRSPGGQHLLVNVGLVLLLHEQDGQVRLLVLGGALEDLGHQDRKSTRLNSSHTVISYAVFCLKKKTWRLWLRPGADRACDDQWRTE